MSETEALYIRMGRNTRARFPQPAIDRARRVSVTELIQSECRNNRHGWRPPGSLVFPNSRLLPRRRKTRGER